MAKYSRRMQTKGGLGARRVADAPLDRTREWDKVRANHEEHKEYEVRMIKVAPHSNDHKMINNGIIREQTSVVPGSAVHGKVEQLEACIRMIRKNS